MNSKEESDQRKQRYINPLLIWIALLLAGVALTHVLPAGKFDRHGSLVVPGTYQALEKVNGLSALLSTKRAATDDKPARAASLVQLFMAIPAGMVRQADLIVMLLFAGGMFGVMRATGVIDAGVDRLLDLTSGNVYYLTVGLMLVLACGATFLGFITEYIAIVPLVLTIGKRLQLPNLYTAAVVILGALIGYAACVTGPISLAVAQPLAGVPLFSGILPRLALFIVMFGLGLAYVLLYLYKLPKITYVPKISRLSYQHVSVLLALILGSAVLIFGTVRWSWGNPELGASFIAFSLILALVAKLKSSSAADAFVEGMKVMTLVCFMVGLGAAMEILLRSSQVLDSIVQAAASLSVGQPRIVVAEGMLVFEMIFDQLIHSTAGKAVITVPILAPIAQLSGLDGQVPVTAVLLGSGLANMISPTNGVLLAFLAASEVGYAQWARFFAPLFITLCFVAFIAIYLMVAFGS